MTGQRLLEYNTRRIEMQGKLTDEFGKLLKERKPTQREKDLYNLRIIRWDIHKDSRYGRSGVISTLDRAIRRLEMEGGEER